MVGHNYGKVCLRSAVLIMVFQVLPLVQDICLQPPGSDKFLLNVNSSRVH